MRASRRELLRQVGHVFHDLPVFLTAPLYRTWHQHWGATEAEIAEAMPGDAHQPHAQFHATRAITIDAAPSAVWPWLVQVGCLRAGWYSNDLLDNLGHPSATTIVPDLQHLEVGQWVPMSPKGPPSDRTALRVDSFEVDQWLLWTKPDSTWVWKLTPTASGGTRVVTRIRAAYDWRHPVTAALGVILMEFGDFAMLRRMLRGIKARAESAVGLSEPPDVPMPRPPLGSGVYLYWLPLGAGAHVVRLSGRAFEAITAGLEHRRRRDLYHSALELVTADGRYVIEMTPVPRVDGADRGVVAEGAVGSKWARGFRIFRYEVHRWRSGVIPDVDCAIGSPVRLSADAAVAQRVLDLASSTPTPVWGRDEFQAGEMWNSNSVTSWLLSLGGIDVDRIAPPGDGRAPGWAAGLTIAERGASSGSEPAPTCRPATAVTPRTASGYTR